MVNNKPDDRPMANIRGGTSRSIVRLSAIGTLVVATLVAGFGGWSAIASISGAVIASGTVVVESNIKRIQHSEGGIVGAIHVSNGDKVKAGDTVLALDDTLTRANLAIVQTRLDDFDARAIRLLAEQDGSAAMLWHAELKARERVEPRLGNLMKGQELLFAARRATRQGQRAQLDEQIHQTEEEIKGLIAQRDAKADELVLIDEELVGIEELRAQELVPLTRLIALKRQKTGLRGDHGRLVGEIARARGRISETRLKLLQLDRDFQTEVAGEFNEVSAQIAELSEQKIAADDRLRRIELRAPVDGYVHELIAHTVGGVISAGETVMVIVPDLDALIVEAAVPPDEIDRVHLIQPALIKFSAFNQRTTPELMGTVTHVAADASVNADTRLLSYSVRVALDDGEREKLGGKILIPGMPAEVFIQTEPRQVLSYLLKPITDQLEKAFREE